jgi:hypothetical protein
MFGFNSEVVKIDSGCVELILNYLVSQKLNWFYLKLEIVDSDSRNEFYT